MKEGRGNPMVNFCFASAISWPQNDDNFYISGAFYLTAR
jgi:hypothetical protein